MCKTLVSLLVHFQFIEKGCDVGDAIAHLISRCLGRGFRLSKSPGNKREGH